MPICRSRNDLSANIYIIQVLNTFKISSTSAGTFQIPLVYRHLLITSFFSLFPKVMYLIAISTIRNKMQVLI